MTFEQATTDVPTAVQKIRVVLENELDGEGGVNRAAYYRLWITYSDGREKVTAPGNDLQPHLTQNQIDGLVAFMDAMRAKAEAEVLPQE